MQSRMRARKARILVVSVESQIQKLLRSILSTDGYSVSFAADAAAAIGALPALPPELVLLDLNQADETAHGAILEIRRNSDLPLIVLSYRQREADLVAVLDLGADDYVEKPFRAGELLARIRSLIRRSLKAHSEEATYHRGDLLINVLNHSVTRGGEPVKLTPTEFEILTLLVRSAGRIVPYRRFLEPATGGSYRKSKQALRSSIWGLRQKIEETPNDPRIVLTEERIGYRIGYGPARTATSHGRNWPRSHMR
jgi:two-component system, OmpR family, KDP operon response regulator KdpE